MEGAAVCTNGELFIGWCEKPMYKEGTRSGRELPSYSTMEGAGGLPTGRGRRGFWNQL